VHLQPDRSGTGASVSSPAEVTRLSLVSSVWGERYAFPEAVEQPTAVSTWTERPVTLTAKTYAALVRKMEEHYRPGYIAGHDLMST
jgi:hypothetical protein